MDPLVLQPAEEWPRLRDSFKNDLPLGIAGFNLLDTQIHFRNLRLDCPFQVYCPYGDIANGMVAKLQKNKINEVYVMAASEETTELEQALLNTSVIDWSMSRIVVPFVMPGSTRKLMNEVYPRLGVKLVMDSPSYIHVLDRNSEPYTIAYPEETYVAPLRPQHVPQVDRVWPHRYPSSDWMFNLLIQAGQSYGLFSSTDHSLVAWMFINKAGYLSHLYCEEHHRRKGYAECIAKHVINDQISKGKNVFCYILDGNSTSTKLFTKLGFQNIGLFYWMHFEKQ